MKLLLCFSLLAVVVFAHGGHGHGGCGDDCLAACKSCSPLIDLGTPQKDENNTVINSFLYGSRVPGDCWQATCADKNAVLLVQDKQYASLVCFQNKWHFGYPQLLEETDSAECVSPNGNCTDPNASLQFTGAEFACVCNKPSENREEEFDKEFEVCSACGSTSLNVYILIDKSGSMNSVFSPVLDFAKDLVQFLKVSDDGNHVSVVSVSDTYNIDFPWVNGSTTGAIQSVIAGISDGGLSNIGIGMEAVKAELIQPLDPADNRKNVLIVLTDGSVLDSSPCINDIHYATSNLNALGVETFVVQTNEDHVSKTLKIASQFNSHLFTIQNTSDYFNTLNELQRAVCV